MKKYISLPFIIAVTLLFVGCKKNDGFITEEYLDRLEPVPAISTAVDPTGSAAIDLLNLAGFQGKFTVSSYFTSKPNPTKIDIVVRKNGSNSNTRVFLAGVTTFPSSYTVTAAQIAALFGTPIALGDSYDFSADLYVGEKKYEAFPVGAVGTSAGPVNFIGYSQFARFAAICAYDPTIYQGNFKAQDQFGDADGATIVLTRVSNNSFSFMYPSALNPRPIIVTVNTGNNNTSTGAAQIIGSQWDPAYGYPNTAVYVNPSLNSSTGSVTPCDRRVTLFIQWGVQGGALQFGGGPYRLILTKI